MAEGATLPPLDVTQYEPEGSDLVSIRSLLEHVGIEVGPEIWVGGVLLDEGNNPDLETGAGEAEFDCS
jgi:hypothetical protein